MREVVCLGSGADGASVTVKRRFSEFERLHTMMRARCVRRGRGRRSRARAHTRVCVCVCDPSSVLARQNIDRRRSCSLDAPSLLLTARVRARAGARARAVSG